MDKAVRLQDDARVEVQAKTSRRMPEINDLVGNASAPGADDPTSNNKTNTDDTNRRIIAVVVEVQVQAVIAWIGKIYDASAADDDTFGCLRFSPHHLNTSSSFFGFSACDGRRGLVEVLEGREPRADEAYR